MVDGSASYASAGPAPTSYSETSAVGGQDDPLVDGPGTFVCWTSPALTAPADLVGRAAPDGAAGLPHRRGHPAAGHGRQLILFAKLYDVAPDGTQTLKGRLVSPGPGRRREPSADRRAARRRAPLRDRPPAAAGRSRRATSPTRQHRTAAGHGAHQHRRPRALSLPSCRSATVLTVLSDSCGLHHKSSDLQRRAHVFVHNGHRRDFEA